MTVPVRFWACLGAGCLALAACQSRCALVPHSKSSAATAALSVALPGKSAPAKPDPALAAAVAADRANELQKLASFLGFAKVSRHAPDRVSGIAACPEGEQPTQQLCSKIYAEPGSSETWFLSYGKLKPSAFRLQAVFGNIELSCADLGASHVVRDWHFGSARKQHCAISTGPLAGLEAVVENYPGNAKLLVFSTEYLARDATFQADLRTERDSSPL